MLSEFAVGLGYYGGTLEFGEYQKEASKTSTLRLGGPQGAIAPMLGLASETGSILNTYKKYLRDGIDLIANRETLREELGDLLWYATAIATSCQLDLEDIASANLRRTRDRYNQAPTPELLAALPDFDLQYPEPERFPRSLTVEFIEQVAPTGQLTATMTLISAVPNAFPEGPTRQPNGKFQGFALNSSLGDSLTDNTRRSDGYRFHDAIHFGFMAVLGWSPNMRALLRVKRKSDPHVDASEDGARAVFAEEGLAAVLSRLATRRSGFQRETTVNNEIIEIAIAATTDLEPSVLPGWIWRRAVNQGFNAMRVLTANGGGYLVVDLDRRTLTYRKILSEAVT